MRGAPRTARMLAVAALLAFLLAACQSARPVVLPTSVPATTEPATAMPPALGAGVLAPANLMSPEDLTFDGAYPEDGWLRCDDLSVSKNLERFRGQYKVRSSIAAIWQYGSACNGSDVTARVDEYAWLAEGRTNANEISDGAFMASHLQNLPVEQQKQIRQLQKGRIDVRSAQVKVADGRQQHVAEIVGLDGEAVAYMRIVTPTALPDEVYRQLGESYLARVLGSAAQPGE